MTVSLVWFPYYIVRFKPQQFLLMENPSPSFPYYIVRFKHKKDTERDTDAKGFHTTQYDLNSVEGKYIPLLYTGFHTTQYDLNPFCYFSYISFFICFHTTQYDLNEIYTRSASKLQGFPYYIVRFKPLGRWRENSRGESFHTTQYDLNASTVKKLKLGEKGFHTTQYDLNRRTEKEIYYGERRFHTTQYDLNKTWGRVWAQFLHRVSILHSTI